VHVEVKSSADLNWREITFIKTGIDGKVTLPLYLGQNQSIRLRSDGTWDRLEGISNEQVFKVKPQIKIAAPISAAVSSKAYITGKVNPGKSVQVILERFDGKWTQVATSVTDELGAFAFNYAVGTGPFVTLRVSSMGSTSATTTLAIR
jgi:5-hydroxyisourate hydrolase-like protein (transthyretin family)